MESFGKLLSSAPLDPSLGFGLVRTKLLVRRERTEAEGRRKGVLKEAWHGRLKDYARRRWEEEEREGESFDDESE